MANENIFEPNLQITGSKRESGVITKLEINGKDIPLGAADLENNKEAAIDASTYSAPVEITPSSGKTGMKKVTVTLTNIPDPSSIPDFFIWKTGAGSYVLLPFDDATGITDLAAFEGQKVGYMSGAAEFTYGDVPDYAGFNDLSSFVADSATQFTIENNGNEAVYTLCGAATVICDLDTNVAHTIDVSTYTQPVTIQPSEGKNAMIGAIVTLENIPSGGSASVYCWEGDGVYQYFEFNTAPEDLAAFLNKKGLYSQDTGEMAVNVADPSFVTGYTKTSSDTFTLTFAIGSSITYTRNSTKDFTLW